MVLCILTELAAEMEGREWDPSQTPPPTESAPTSAGLRKPRAGIQRGSSPVPRSGTSSPSTPVEAANPYAASSNKAVVDQQYFSGLGQANAARPEGLRPSEGGK